MEVIDINWSPSFTWFPHLIMAPLFNNCPPIQYHSPIQLVPKFKTIWRSVPSSSGCHFYHWPIDNFKSRFWNKFIFNLLCVICSNLTKGFEWQSQLKVCDALIKGLRLFFLPLHCYIMLCLFRQSFIQPATLSGVCLAPLLHTQPH